MQNSSDTNAPEHTVFQETFDAFQAARFREIGMLTKALIEAEGAIEAERLAHQATRTALETAEFNASHGYQQMLESTSWRVTAPLRWISTKVRR